MMTRKEIYDLIKENDLAEEVQEAFGRNFTQVSTNSLKEFIYDYDCTLLDEDDAAMFTEDEEDDEEEVNTKSCTHHTSISVDDPFEAACLVFLGTLNDMGVLDSLLDRLPD